MGIFAIGSREGWHQVYPGWAPRCYFRVICERGAHARATDWARRVRVAVIEYAYVVSEKEIGVSDSPFPELQALSSRPSRKLAAVLCMDVRLDPLQILGLKLGEAHILRNAGAAVTADTLRSLAVSQHVMGTNEVIVVAHTDCGMGKRGDRELAEIIRKATGIEVDVAFHTFADLEDHVRAQMATLRNSPMLKPGTLIHGFIFDISKGALVPVAPVAPGKRPSGPTLPGSRDLN